MIVEIEGIRYDLDQADGQEMVAILTAISCNGADPEEIPSKKVASMIVVFETLIDALSRLHADQEAKGM